ncbi:MAG: hypothetical protein MK108_11435 [Mariniblastus sp.]|nr:hypothetical protein [Mariniblastus sp.]
MSSRWTGFMQGFTTEHRQAAAASRAVQAEQRVNLIRIVAIVVFYVVHFVYLINPSVGQDAAVPATHTGETSIIDRLEVTIAILCLGWLMQAFAIHLTIAKPHVPAWLPLWVTVGDLVWLTLLLCLTTGPAGPMVIGYFLIIMLSGARFDLQLVRYTTVLAMIGYLVLLGVTRWPRGLFKEIGLQSVPPYHEIMILVAMILSGVIVGQIVRQSYLLVEVESRADQEGVS